jgi:hypothetical protein
LSTTRAHVIVSGIVSLVPSEVGGGIPASWTIRLQDAQHHQHFPSIVADLNDLRGAGNPPPAETQALQDGTTLAGWYLGKGEVEVSTISQSTLTIRSPQPLPNVLHIASGFAKGQAARTHSDYTKDVWLKVGQGRLSATQIDSQQWRWFLSANGRMEPALWIADEVCWSFEVEGSVLTVEHEGWTLQVGAPRGGEIELRLQNMLKQDLFPRPGQARANDYHAQMYFDLSQSPPNLRPYLASKKAKGAPAGDHTHRLAGQALAADFPEEIEPGVRVNCPPAGWAG